MPTCIHGILGWLCLPIPPPPYSHFSWASRGRSLSSPGVPWPLPFGGQGLWAPGPHVRPNTQSYSLGGKVCVPLGPTLGSRCSRPPPKPIFPCYCVLALENQMHRIGRPIHWPHGPHHWLKNDHKMTTDLARGDNIGYRKIYTIETNTAQ